MWWKFLYQVWTFLCNLLMKFYYQLSFFSLFQTHPEVQDAFMPFQKLAQEDMEHSAILRSHALRVMGTVDKCLARIRTPEKLQTLMHELGERHVNYNARYDFVDVSSLQCGSKYF